MPILKRGFTPTPKMILAPVIFSLEYLKDKIKFVYDNFSLFPVRRKKSRTSLVWGFTLIELLVVIAVIGILSGTVLVSLNNARKMAKDARIKSELRSMYNVLNLGFDGNTYPDIVSTTYRSPTLYYGSLFLTSPNYEGLKFLSDDIKKQSFSGDIIYNVRSIDVGLPVTSYALHVRLNSSTTQYACIDSTGKAALVDSGETWKAFCTPQSL